MKTRNQINDNFKWDLSPLCSSDEDFYKGLEKALPISVGDNCWFGANVTVLQGVSIGKGCVIAAGSVIINDIPDNCLVAGVPACIKKHIEQ